MYDVWSNHFSEWPMVWMDDENDAYDCPIVMESVWRERTMNCANKTETAQT